MTAVEIAGVFSFRFRQKYETDIDEMKLHKMLYLAQRESLIRFGRPLFPETIHAWKYGPVVLEVRRTYHADLIPQQVLSGSASRCELDVIDYIFNTYSNKNSWSLSRLTHAEYSWQHARKAAVGAYGDCVMSIDDIAKDAQRVATRRAAIRALGLA